MLSTMQSAATMLPDRASAAVALAEDLRTEIDALYRAAEDIRMQVHRNQGMLVPSQSIINNCGSIGIEMNDATIQNKLVVVDADIAAEDERIRRYADPLMAQALLDLTSELSAAHAHAGRPDLCFVDASRFGEDSVQLLVDAGIAQREHDDPASSRIRLLLKIDE